jgi:hypothetical protein
LLKPGHSHWIVDRDCFSPIGRIRWVRNCFSPSDFWNFFIPNAFKKQPNPFKIDFPCILDWKSFLSPFLRDITGHSKARSFCFQKQNGGPVLFYKESCLDTTWKGFYEDFGFNLMSSYPIGHPGIVPPTPLDDDAFRDLSSFYPHMPQQFINEWSAFANEQFPVDAFSTQFSDFWLTNLEDVYNNDFNDTVLPRFDNDVPNIIVENHPFVSGFQCKFDAIIAYQTGRTWSLGKVNIVSNNSVELWKGKRTKNVWSFSKSRVIDILPEQIILTEKVLTKKNILRKAAERNINKFLFHH